MESKVLILRSDKNDSSNIFEYFTCNKDNLVGLDYYNYVIDSKSINFSANNISDFMKVIDSVCNYYQTQGELQTYYSELEIVFIKQLLISNMRRLKLSKSENKFEGIPRKVQFHWRGSK